jgi:hypothetical protein
MSSKAAVDNVVTNFNSNFKSVNTILDDNRVYTTLSDILGKTKNKMSSVEYAKLRNYYTYLSNSISELEKYIASEGINLRNNDQSLKTIERDINRYDKRVLRHESLIKKNEELVGSKTFQYELAVKRNEHRRQMIMMLALLNTLGLMIYYFTSK